VAISFSRRLLQPIQDRVNPTYEYWGQSDPTRVVRRKVSKEEMVARMKNIFIGCIYNRKCPKALSVYRPSEEVSLRPSFFATLQLVHFTDLSVCFQFCEGIYWCPALLRNEEDQSFKVCAAWDVQVPPQQCIEEYISDSSVGSDDEGPTTRRVSPKVATSVS
jgi:hypothetical protein